jgi:hypothetical protein
MRLFAQELDFTEREVRAAFVTGSMTTINLPTDERLAGEGIVEFEKLLASLPEELAKKAKSDEDLFWLYVGIYPEIGGWSGSLLDELGPNLEQAAILMDAINESGWARVVIHSHKGYSIVNLRAAARVIRDNQGYFPQEAFSNPVAWLINNPSQWYASAVGITEVRYGLLSGYPLNACLKNVAYSKARKRLMNSVLPEETVEEAIFLRYFVMLGSEAYKLEELGKFCEILRSKGKGLFSEDEITLWAQKHSVSRGTYSGFMGFDASDDAWAVAADDLCRKIKAIYLLE